MMFSRSPRVETHPFAADRSTVERFIQVNWGLMGLLRFVMACVVVGVHSTWFFPGHPIVLERITDLGGKAAVIGFLIVSGFSIAASVDRAEEGFYRRRVLRIYPSYITAVAWTVLVQIASGGVVAVPGQEFQASGPLAVAGNLIFLQTIVVSALGFNYSVWSLAVEVLYYAIAPWLRRMGTRVLMAAMLISAISFLLPTRLDHGIVIAAFTKLKIIKYFWCWGLGFWLWNDRRRMALPVAAALSIGLVVNGPQTSESLAWIPIATTFVALYLASRVKFGPSLDRVCNYLGDLSYPLYLAHLPTLIFGWMLGLRGLALYAPVAVVAVIFTAAIEHRLRPRLNRLAVRWSVPAPAPIAE